MKKLVIILSFILTVFVCILPCKAYALQFATSAKSAVVMERTSRRVLYEKNADIRLPMASTTKIMTALVVSKNCDINEVVSIPKCAVGVEGSSLYLREGEHLTVKELLYGLMLRSGNDCAVALALHVGGSLQNFADMMNAQSQLLGCENTHFVTPHGLPCENHFTTARDLAVIACSALEDKTVSEVVSTKNIKIANEGFDYPRVLQNKNKLLSMMDNADGVKTGYTKKAGRCFVGSATKDGMQVVCVLLDCGPMFEECKQLLENAFANYKLVAVVPKNKIFAVTTHKHGTEVYYACKSGFYYPLTAEEAKNITVETICDGDEAKIYILLYKQLIFSQKLVII